MARRRVIAGKGSCAWCQNPADSEEEVYPHWAAKELRRLGYKAFTSFSGRSGSPLSGRPFALADVRWSRRHSDSAAHSAVKCVCVSCNNGWMSRLEKEASRLIKPMLGDLSPRRLHDADARLLAAFALGRAMIIDYATNDTPVFSSAHRSSFKGGLSIPGGFHLWVAAAKHPLNQFLAGFLGPMLVDSQRVIVHHSTYQLGHLVVQSLFPRLEPGGDVAPAPTMPQPRSWDDYSEPVWPSLSATPFWPPRFTLSDKMAARFLQRWFAPGVRIPGHPANAF